ncbi:MAG: hypothetical protein HZA79_15990 [Sphingobacteriales bacterium]|nr:hypothetical protein [Sphingobacteriales bacterium]
MAKQNHSMRDSKDRDMISFETCKEILNSNGNQYTDEEIYKIREYMYQLAEIQVRHFKQWQEDQLHSQFHDKLSQDNKGQ